MYEHFSYTAAAAAFSLSLSFLSLAESKRPFEVYYDTPGDTRTQTHTSHTYMDTKNEMAEETTDDPISIATRAKGTGNGLYKAKDYEKVQSPLPSFPSTPTIATASLSPSLSRAARCTIRSISSSLLSSAPPP